MSQVVKVHYVASLRNLKNIVPNISLFDPGQYTSIKSQAKNTKSVDNPLLLPPPTQYTYNAPVLLYNTCVNFTEKN